MILVLKNVYINNLADTVNKYNNTYHSTNKIMPVDGKSSIYIDLNKKSNKEVGDHILIS